MAHQDRFKKPRPQRHSRPPRTADFDRPAITKPKTPRTYGKPFIVLENEQKNTFQYANGAWEPYEMTIAQCSEEGLVQKLPQQINNMTRYEVRLVLSYEQ